MNRNERWLRFLLYVAAIPLLCATLAIFLPTQWMAATHQWLGMGEFPNRPLTGYLTRSIAAVYTYHGAMLWLLAGDVRRFLPMIRLTGCCDTIFGATVLGIDLVVGMPWYWTAIEAPSLIVFGVVIFWLSRGVPKNT
jgi:hypothetical protein